MRPFSSKVRTTLSIVAILLIVTLVSWRMHIDMPIHLGSQV